MQIKKILFYSGLSFVFTYSVQAQMVDLIGSMAVGGAQSTQSVHSVGAANKRMQNTRFMQDLQLKIADISMTYGENYQQMPVQNLTMRPYKVIFRPVQEGRAFEAFVYGIQKEGCISLLKASWDNLQKVRIVSNGLSRDYGAAEAANQANGICITANQIALIFQ